MRRAAKPESGLRLALYHALLLGAGFAFWYAMTTPGVVSAEFAKNTAFFFGKPLEVLRVTWEWFASGKIYPHLAITLVETGNLLLIPARSGGNPEWIAKAQDLIKQSKRAIKAAEDHDRQATFDIGADIYETCVNCHKQFDPSIRDAK